LDFPPNHGNGADNLFIGIPIDLWPWHPRLFAIADYEQHLLRQRIERLYDQRPIRDKHHVWRLSKGMDASS
jgi:hypothetical protein